MLTAAPTQLAVWGDPIAHSRSPRLHAAAYRLLGLDWTYHRRRVDEASFSRELLALDASWRGLSLTYPLKASAFAAAAVRDRRAELTGAVNTLLLDDGAGPRGFNTDVGGIVAALGELGVESATSARIVGAGATASSAIAAFAELGTRRIEVVARRPEAVVPLARLGAALGIAVTGAGFGDVHSEADVTVATLPGEAQVTDAAAAALADTGGPLLDVVYGHWPTALSAAWTRRGREAASGLSMLLHQAFLQVRLFVTGDVDVPVDDDARVLAAMRSALVED